LPSMVRQFAYFKAKQQQCLFAVAFANAKSASGVNVNGKKIQFDPSEMKKARWLSCLFKSCFKTQWRILIGFAKDSIKKDGFEKPKASGAVKGRFLSKFLDVYLQGLRKVCQTEQLHPEFSSWLNDLLMLMKCEVILGVAAKVAMLEHSREMSEGVEADASVFEEKVQAMKRLIQNSSPENFKALNRDFVTENQKEWIELSKDSFTQMLWLESHRVLKAIDGFRKLAEEG